MGGGPREACGHRPFAYRTGRRDGALCTPIGAADLGRPGSAPRVGSTCGSGPHIRVVASGVRSYCGPHWATRPRGYVGRPSPGPTLRGRRLCAGLPHLENCDLCLACPGRGTKPLDPNRSVKALSATDGSEPIEEVRNPDPQPDGVCRAAAGFRVIVLGLPWDSCHMSRCLRSPSIRTPTLG